MNDQTIIRQQPEPLGKFAHRDFTANGEPRARVHLLGLKTLWFNTGTLCNVSCVNCYIGSSPTNDSLVYISAKEVQSYLDEISRLNWRIEDIGFTGGEPFMNPEIIDMADACLSRAFRVLVLTNAMRPMMRARVRDGLVQLHKAYGDRLTIRVSLDHYLSKCHDSLRGRGSFDVALEGMNWLQRAGIRTTVAGRTIWGETESELRSGFAALYAANGFGIDAWDPALTVLFPEMDETLEVPEISTGCWKALGKSPGDVMCARSRMVVKRKGSEAPVVVACTLLPHEDEFELGGTLEEAARPVHLNHPHCSRFCVLGGASCSA